MPPEYAIRCEALTKRYGDTIAVDGLDLTVTPGEVVGFLGPNGAGKTTTLRMLLGLVRPTGGRAALNGRPLPDPDGLHRVGAMVEEPAFYPWLSGRSNLAVLALVGGRVPPVAIDSALDRAGLTEVIDRKVRAYSQGMRQRLGLAAALLRRPSLLLLDEPTNGLDPAGIREFRQIIHDVAAEGVTVFLSSHLLAEVEQVCDRVAVVDRGRLVEDGAVGDVGVIRREVRVLVDVADRRAARALLSRWPVRSDGTGTLIVETQDGRDVNAALSAGGVIAHSISVARPALEDRFLTLIDDVQELPHNATVGS
jgi:ABC-2 type transport system ATP-binding protein